MQGVVNSLQTSIAQKQVSVGDQRSNKGEASRGRTESNQLDAVVLGGGPMMMQYQQESGDGSIMRLNSLQVESNHAGGRLLDPSFIHQNLKLQLTAQNATDLSAMTAVGDEFLSPNTASQNTAQEAETTTLFSTAQPGPGQPEGTIEMGYITFFPKNQNDNFQSIPEQPAAQQPEPPERKPADATNGWTNDEAAHTNRKQPALKPVTKKSPVKKHVSTKAFASPGKPLKPTLTASMDNPQQQGSSSNPASKKQIQVRKIDSTNISSGNASKGLTQPSQRVISTQNSGTSSNMPQNTSSVSNGQPQQKGNFTLVPRRKILFLAEANGNAATNQASVHNNQVTEPSMNGSERSAHNTPSPSPAPNDQVFSRVSPHSRNRSNHQQQAKLQHQIAAAASGGPLLQRLNSDEIGGGNNSRTNAVLSSNGGVAPAGQQSAATNDPSVKNNDAGQSNAANKKRISKRAADDALSGQHEEDMEEQRKKQLFLDRQVEKIMAKKEARMNSEPARKSRRQAAGNYQSEAAFNSKPTHRRSDTKDTAQAQTAMNDTGRKSNKNHQAPAGKPFHPNAASVDTNVVSFMNEKPGTSDINQPSNRKIKINRKLQRNGTTDTGAFRSSYYNKIRNDASIINGDTDGEALQQHNMTVDHEVGHDDDEDDDDLHQLLNSHTGRQNMAISSNYHEGDPTGAANQHHYSNQYGGVPQLQSVDSPKRATRRQLEQQQVVLSTGKAVRRAQHRREAGNAGSSTREGFESSSVMNVMNASSALSNERIRMATVNTTTQDSTSNYYQPATNSKTTNNPNHGIRSNISEINEADFSANLRSDYSVSSPKGTSSALPSISRMVGGSNHANNQTPQDHSQRNGQLLTRDGAISQTTAPPPTTSYSTASTQKHQKRYGGYAATGNTAKTARQQDQADATTMASYLESHSNNKYQVASKFSTYEDGSGNHNNMGHASTVSHYNKNNPGMQFNYSQMQPEPSSHVAQKQVSQSLPPSRQQANLNQQIALYTHSPVDIASLNNSTSSRQHRGDSLQSPTPLQQHAKPTAMYYPSQLQGGATTPTVPNGDANGSLDYKDILDERFASPRVLVKQSQPLLSKNQFISYLNDGSVIQQDAQSQMPLSPKRRPQAQMKQFQNATANGSISQSVSPMVMSSSGHHSYIEKFQAMQQAMHGASSQSTAANTRSQLVETGTGNGNAPPAMGGGTAYQNLRADEIIKKYHSSNTDVQQSKAAGVFSRAGGGASGTVSPRQLDFDRNIGTANHMNGSFVSDTLLASANMSIGSSRQQANRGAHMEHMLQKIRNAVSPTAVPDQSSYLMSPRAAAQLTPLNQSVMSAGADLSSFDQRQDVGSRQSQVCRKVIEEFAQKYSTIDKKRGSINPRRQNPIVKQPVSKRQASRAADCQLSPRLPDCFLFGPVATANTANEANWLGAPSSASATPAVSASDHQRASATMSHSPVARRSQNLYINTQQKNSQLSHISATTASAPAKIPYPQHALVSTGNSIMQSLGAGGGSEMQQLSLMQQQQSQQYNVTNR